MLQVYITMNNLLDNDLEAILYYCDIIINRNKSFSMVKV